MMQSSEIEQRFSNIESTVQQLKQAVQTQQNVPQELKDVVQQLDQQTIQARQVLQSHDESRIVECVDNLEQISDRAGQAVKSSQNVDENVRKAVMQAHNELSTLKHQLH